MRQRLMARQWARRFRRVWVCGPLPTKGRQYAAAFQRPPFPHLWCLSSQGSESVKGGVLCRRSEPLTDSLPCVQSRLQGKGGRGSQGACPLAEYEAAPHARLKRAVTPADGEYVLVLVFSAIVAMLPFAL